MKIGEIYKILDEISPFASQEEWDNSGLLVGSFETCAQRVYLSLDVDDELLDEVHSGKLTREQVKELYAKTEKKLDIKTGDFAIVSTRYGRDMVKVIGQTKKTVGIKAADIVTIERKANSDDFSKAKKNKSKEDEAFRVFKEKVAFHGLDMKLISVHFLTDEQKAIFFFSSDNRVDFRELVKDLVSVFKMAIL